MKTSLTGSESYGYGHSTGGYGSTSHGGYSSGYGHDDCCPLVVDPLTLTAILGAIAAATAFFNVLITMNITRRKKRESSSFFGNVVWAGSYVDI